MSNRIRALAGLAGVVACAAVPASARANCPTCPIPIVPGTTVTDPTNTVSLYYSLSYVPSRQEAFQSAVVVVNPDNKSEPAGASGVLATSAEAGGYPTAPVAELGEGGYLSTTPTGIVPLPPVHVP